jgi:3-hydroxyisobutyrate dehydrogenase-like beta-hydroxyacid dehydrogenase
VWARRQSSLTALSACDFTATTAVTELGRLCQVVVLCLRTDDDVEDVLVRRGLLSALSPGAVVVNHGTGSPSAAARIAEQASRFDVRVIDAPVSGGGSGAERRELTAMIGGEAQGVAFVRPVLACYCARLHHFGGPGAGQAAKLLNNGLYAANLSAAAESIALTRQLGVDPVEFARCVRTASGRSAAFELVAGAGLTLQRSQHVANLLAKDIGLLAATCPDAEALASRGCIDPLQITEAAALSNE